MVLTFDTLPAHTAFLHPDDLINRDRATLDALFRNGTTPAIEQMTGRMRGRILAGNVPLLLTSQSALFLVNQPWLLWKGASFEALNAQRGSGVHHFGVGRFDYSLLRFETLHAAPLLGREDVLLMSYDLPGNLPGVRRFRDDVRQIHESLWLGATFFYQGGVHHFVNYFGLTPA